MESVDGECTWMHPETQGPGENPWAKWVCQTVNKAGSEGWGQRK